MTTTTTGTITTTTAPGTTPGATTVTGALDMTTTTTGTTTTGEGVVRPAWRHDAHASASVVTLAHAVETSAASGTLGVALTHTYHALAPLAAVWARAYDTRDIAAIRALGAPLADAVARRAVQWGTSGRPGALAIGECAAVVKRMVPPIGIGGARDGAPDASAALADMLAMAALAVADAADALALPCAVVSPFGVLSRVDCTNQPTAWRSHRTLTAWGATGRVNVGRPISGHAWRDVCGNVCDDADALARGARVIADAVARYADAWDADSHAATGRRIKGTPGVPPAAAAWLAGLDSVARAMQWAHVAQWWASVATATAALARAAHVTATGAAAAGHTWRDASRESLARLTTGLLAECEGEGERDVTGRDVAARVAHVTRHASATLAGHAIWQAASAPNHVAAVESLARASGACHAVAAAAADPDQNCDGAAAALVCEMAAWHVACNVAPLAPSLALVYAESGAHVGAHAMATAASMRGDILARHGARAWHAPSAAVQWHGAGRDVGVVALAHVDAVAALGDADAVAALRRTYARAWGEGARAVLASGAASAPGEGARPAWWGDADAVAILDAIASATAHPRECPACAHVGA